MVPLKAPLGSGAEALELIKGWLPDGMLIDHWMPGITGLELIQKIENISDRKIKTILFSACLTEGLIEEARSVGVAACISKPFDLEELKAIVRAVVG